MSGPLSVRDLDHGREGAVLWILVPVHSHLERIAIPTRNLRIEPAVLGDREQVPGDETEPYLVDAVQPEPAELFVREAVAQRQLLELGVRPALDEVVVRIEAVVEPHAVIRQRLLGTAGHRIRNDAARRGVLRLARLVLHLVAGRLERPLARPVVDLAT